MARPQQRSGNKNFGMIVAAIALVGVATLGYLATRPKAGPIEVDPNLPPAKAEGYTIGRADAPVKVMEFADFECPACAQFAVLTEPDVRTRLVDAGIIQYTFYDFPLPMHQNTWVASNAAACANDQGKFWEMHDRIFMGQNDWNTQATSRPAKVMNQYAKELGLDTKAFEACLDESRHNNRVAANKAEAERRQVSQTPSFIIGTKLYQGGMSFDDFMKAVNEAKASAPDAPATPASDSAKR